MNQQMQASPPSLGKTAPRASVMIRPCTTPEEFRACTEVEKEVWNFDAGEAAGMFLPINSGGENPYEVDTGVLLICPLVSSHA